MYSDPCDLRPPIQPAKYDLKLKVVLKYRRGIFILKIYNWCHWYPVLKCREFLNRGVLNRRDHCSDKKINPIFMTPTFLSPYVYRIYRVIIQHEFLVLLARPYLYYLKNRCRTPFFNGCVAIIFQNQREDVWQQFRLAVYWSRRQPLSGQWQSAVMQI